jgi:hypothetical protein
MREEKRSFHKQRKFVCPNCGKVRFQQPADKKQDRRKPPE